MSSLIKSTKLGYLFLKNTPVVVTAVRNHWNKDFTPAPYPKTEAERLKSAKKYNMDPSEYEPYPDDGNGWGDYPKLPLVGVEQKDLNYPYDVPALRRNFQEPYHIDYELIREDRVNMNAKLRVPLWLQCLQFFGTMAGAYAIYYFFENFKMFHRVTPPQLPGPGKKHYSFESSE